MTIKSIQKWHFLARPIPDNKAFNVQLGCHFEEVAEMVETLLFHYPGTQFSPTLGENSSVYHAIKTVADALKSGQVTAEIADRKGFADSVGDQVVTVVGAAYCAVMNPTLIVERVDQSNWSKFHEGVPKFMPNGKIAKAESYKEPDLEGTY